MRLFASNATGLDAVQRLEQKKQQFRMDGQGAESGDKGQGKGFQHARIVFTTDQWTPIAQIFRLGLEPVVRDLTTRLDSLQAQGDSRSPGRNSSRSRCEAGTG